MSTIKAFSCETPYLLTPQLVANLDVCQNHEAERSKICDDEKTGVVNLWVDFVYDKENDNECINWVNK